MQTKRIIAGIIDFIIIAVIYEIPFFILIILPLIAGGLSSINMIDRIFFCTLIALFLLIFKDVFKKGSVGKQIMKLEIIDIKTNEKAFLSKRILRNLTWFLSFVEVIVLMATGKRIGDRIAGTEVVAAVWVMLCTMRFYEKV